MLICASTQTKNCLRGFANNTGADQPDQPLVIRFVESFICKLATGEISIISIAVESGLKLALSETPKTGFLATRPIWDLIRETCHQRLSPGKTQISYRD